MSTRKARAVAGATVSAALDLLQLEHKRNATLRAALEMAQAALAEAPRKLTPCTMAVEHAMTQGLFDKARCSEFSAVCEGWRENWKFCPACGSSIASAEREKSPFAREQREILSGLAERIGIGEEK